MFVEISIINIQIKVPKIVEITMRSLRYFSFGEDFYKSNWHVPNQMAFNLFLNLLQLVKGLVAN